MGAGDGESQVTAKITRRDVGEPRQLSLGQQRLWYLDQLSPGSPAYNVPYVMGMRGQLHPLAFHRALEAVVARHEILRTVILAPEGRPVPVLLRKFSVDLKQIDLRNCEPQSRQAKAQHLVFEEARRPFNLARDVLFRAVLVRLSDHEYQFLHVAPHLAFEGSSVGVLYRELEQFYEAFVAGREAQLSPLPFQYSDFAAWQREYLQGERLVELAHYWKDQLTGATPLNLPTDFARPAIHSMTGRRHFFVLAPELLRVANRFFQESGTTAFRGLCAAFLVLLHSYSGGNDICLGSPVAPPRELGLENLIGFFVNTVVLRCTVTPDMSFRALIGGVTKVVRDAVAHSALTFDKVVEAVRPPRDSGRTPLFQVNFRAPRSPYPVLRLPGLEIGPPQYADNGTSKFDLSLEIECSRGEHCYFEYRTDLFAESTIAQMERDYEEALAWLIANPDVPAGSIPLVGKIHAKFRHAGEHRC